MAKKTSKKALETTIIQAEVFPVPVQPVKRELVLEGDPEAQLAFASKAAKALMKIVSKKPKPVVIRGKQYLEYGDWQVLGRFYGATAEIEWTEKLKTDDEKTILDDKGRIWGYEVRSLVKRNGKVISSAENMCTRDEARWRDADDYAIRSMAQTRTAAKALRNAFGWVAELAGYSATPAEEMPYEAPKSGSTKPYKVEESEQRLKEKIVHLMTLLALKQDNRQEAEESIKFATELELKPENYKAIVQKLETMVLKDPLAKINFKEDPDRG